MRLRAREMRWGGMGWDSIKSMLAAAQEMRISIVEYITHMIGYENTGTNEVC